jgi:hypothetical protein
MTLDQYLKSKQALQLPPPPKKPTWLERATGKDLSRLVVAS